MVECEHFEILSLVQDGIVGWELRTDLPKKSIVMISAIRYVENRAGFKFQWSIFEDRVFCDTSMGSGRNGAKGSFNISTSEAEAIERFGDRAGVRPASDTALTLDFCLVAYQRELIEEFGEDNARLVGGAVENHSLQRSLQLNTPYTFPSSAFD